MNRSWVDFTPFVAGPCSVFAQTWVITSMTTLLVHTVAHSLCQKTNNHPIKKSLSLAVSCVKEVKNWNILTGNFLGQKWSKSFYFFIDEYQFRRSNHLALLKEAVFGLGLKECLVQGASDFTRILLTSRFWRNHC